MSVFVDQAWQVKADAYMRANYDAIRSSLTAAKWVPVSSGCWVCGYVSLPDDPVKEPVLFLAHYWEGESVLVVYTTTGKETI